MNQPCDKEPRIAVLESAFSRFEPLMDDNTKAISKLYTVLAKLETRIENGRWIERVAIAVVSGIIAFSLTHGMQ